MFMRNNLGNRLKVLLSQFWVKFSCFVFFLGGFSSEIFCSEGRNNQNSRKEIVFLIPTFQGPREIILPIDVGTLIKTSEAERFAAFKKHMVCSYEANALKEGDALYPPLTGFLMISDREELLSFLASCCDLAVFETEQEKVKKSPTVIKLDKGNTKFIGRTFVTGGREIGTRKNPILILGNRSLKSKHHVFNQALREMVKGFASDQQGSLANSVTRDFYKRVVNSLIACWGFRDNSLTVAINKVQGKCSRSALVALKGAPDSNFGPPQACSFFPYDFMHLVFDFNQRDCGGLTDLKSDLGRLWKSDSPESEALSLVELERKLEELSEPFTKISLPVGSDGKAIFGRSTFKFPKWVDSSMIAYILMAPRIPLRKNEERKDFVPVSHVLAFFKHLQARVELLPRDILRMRGILKVSSHSSAAGSASGSAAGSASGSAAGSASVAGSASGDDGNSSSDDGNSSSDLAYLEGIPNGYFKDRTSTFLEAQRKLQKLFKAKRRVQELKESLLQSPLKYEREEDIPLSDIQPEEWIVSLLEDAVQEPSLSEFTEEIKEEALYDLKIRLRRQQIRASFVCSYLGEKAPQVQYLKIPPQTIKRFVVAYLSRVSLHKKEDIVQLIQNIFRSFLESESFRATSSLPHSDGLAKEILNGFFQEVIPCAQEAWEKKESDYVIPSPDGMSRKRRGEFLDLARGISRHNFKFIGPDEGSIVGKFLHQELSSEEYKNFKAWGKKRLPR